MTDYIDIICKQYNITREVYWLCDTFHFGSQDEMYVDSLKILYNHGCVEPERPGGWIETQKLRNILNIK